MEKVLSGISMMPKKRQVVVGHVAVVSGHEVVRFAC